MRIVVRQSVDTLAHTLLEYDDIRRHGRPVVHRDPVRAGELGGDGGWVELVLSGGLNITSIVIALAAWLRPREPRRPQDGEPPTVLIEHEGTTVVMRNSSPETIESVVRALRDGGATGPPP
ncbi:effector-associated constant component EACC1 [Actinophytocola sediminis]